MNDKLWLSQALFPSLCGNQLWWHTYKLYYHPLESPHVLLHRYGTHIQALLSPTWITLCITTQVWDTHTSPIITHLNHHVYYYMGMGHTYKPYYHPLESPCVLLHGYGTYYCPIIATWSILCMLVILYRL